MHRRWVISRGCVDLKAVKRLGLTCHFSAAA